MNKHRELAFEIVDKHYCKGTLLDAVSATEEALQKVERETWAAAIDRVKYTRFTSTLQDDGYTRGFIEACKIIEERITAKAGEEADGKA